MNLAARANRPRLRRLREVGGERGAIPIVPRPVTLRHPSDRIFAGLRFSYRRRDLCI